MHGQSLDVFLSQISGFLGSYYIFLSLMNGVAAYLLWVRAGHESRPLFRVPIVDFPITPAFVWLLVSLGFLLMAPLAYSGDQNIMSWISVPKVVRAGINRAMN